MAFRTELGLELEYQMFFVELHAKSGELCFVNLAEIQAAIVRQENLIEVVMSNGPNFLFGDQAMITLMRELRRFNGYRPLSERDLI